MLRFVEILTLRFGKAKVAKAGFCDVKRPIKIWNVDVNNIVISKLIETKNNSKYFKYNSIPKYNKHNISKCNSIRIDNDKLLKKYMELNELPVYDRAYVKTKIRIYGDKVYTKY